MIALAYLATVAAGLVVLAVALRPRRTPPLTPIPPQAPAPALPTETAPELRLILAAAHQLAARLDTAA